MNFLPKAFHTRPGIYYFLSYLLNGWSMKKKSHLVHEIIVEGESQNLQLCYTACWGRIWIKSQKSEKLHFKNVMHTFGPGCKWWIQLGCGQPRFMKLSGGLT